MADRKCHEKQHAIEKLIQLEVEFLASAEHKISPNYFGFIK